MKHARVISPNIDALLVVFVGNTLITDVRKEIIKK